MNTRHTLRKPLKRIRQLAYMCCHPVSHYRCVSSILKSRLADDPAISFKYLGDHLALSLQAHQRRQALASHYELLPTVLQSTALTKLNEGLPIWQKAVAGYPPLSITLEPSTFAPMEGELQLRFSFRTDLCVLTFLLTSGTVFGEASSPILFIGGVQGRVGTQSELREACKLNGEISPSAMLLLAVRTVGRAMGVTEILAIGEEDQISVAFARSKIKFDYRAIWTSAGGIKRGWYYGIPFEQPPRPIVETSRSHRSRTRRRPAAKSILREAIEQQLETLISNPLKA